MKHFLVRTLFISATMLPIGNAVHAQQLVRVGIPRTGAPFAFMDAKTGAPQGMMVEILNAIGRDAGLQLQYQPIVVTTIGPSLIDNTIDMSGYPLQVAPANQDKIRLSDPVMTYGEALAVPKADTKPYATYDDLKGLRVGTVTGTVYVEPLQKAGADVQFYNSATVAVGDLNDGKLDAVVATGPVIVYAAANGTFPNIRAVGTFKATVSIPVTFAVRAAATDLLTTLNASLAKLVAAGTVKAIKTKWGQ
jgi:polar amino acid transport system substrate-binding protein